MRNLKKEITEYFKRNIIDKELDDFEDSYIYFISSKRKLGDERGRIMELDYGVPNFKSLKKGDLRAIANALKCKSKVLYHKDITHNSIFILADGSKVFLKRLVRTEDNKLYSLEEREWKEELNVGTLNRNLSNKSFYIDSYYSWMMWNQEHMQFSSMWKCASFIAKEENRFDDSEYIGEICELISDELNSGIVPTNLELYYKGYIIKARNRLARKLKTQYLECYLEKQGGRNANN